MSNELNISGECVHDTVHFELDVTKILQNGSSAGDLIFEAACKIVCIKSLFCSNSKISKSITNTLTSAYNF